MHVLGHINADSLVMFCSNYSNLHAKASFVRVNDSTYRCDVAANGFEGRAGARERGGVFANAGSPRAAAAAGSRSGPRLNRAVKSVPYSNVICAHGAVAAIRFPARSLPSGFQRAVGRLSNAHHFCLWNAADSINAVATCIESRR